MGRPAPVVRVGGFCKVVPTRLLVLQIFGARHSHQTPPPATMLPRRRVCNALLEPEERLPPGADLKVCGTCKSVRYSSRELQREHWPIHKPVCKPPSVLCKLSAWDCFKFIQKQFEVNSWSKKETALSPLSLCGQPRELVLAPLWSSSSS